MLAGTFAARSIRFTLAGRDRSFRRQADYHEPSLGSDALQTHCPHEKYTSPGERKSNFLRNIKWLYMPRKRVTANKSSAKICTHNTVLHPSRCTREGERRRQTGAHEKPRKLSSSAVDHVVHRKGIAGEDRLRFRGGHARQGWKAYHLFATRNTPVRLGLRTRKRWRPLV